ncbi:MAG: hypothetical protein HOQ22_06195 [Nocardioidaceae bacterium]|nr:hypothetical protein [Nocardioidaceae bacterium]NUS50620.1 hypothetical protein [Nocardioidaceae bacterium]
MSSLRRPRVVTRTVAVLAALLLPAFGYTALSGPAHAASSTGCENGGFSVLGKSGTFTGTVPAPAGRFRVQGRYAQFDVDPADFAVYDQAFTGAPNPLDQTGGRFTPIYASKVPDHRGLTLTSPITVELSGGDLVISRTGPGLSMKLQAKDCANGGIFQMEPSRGDGTRTRIVHRLAPSAFYYDNPNFRAHLGEFLGSECTSVQTGPPSKFCVQVTPRVNIGNDVSPDFVVRDSSQVATRIRQAACGPDFTNNLGLSETRDHCGGMSVWDVASGGRLGMVTGEDATEVANPPTTCTHQCQAQNQVRGRLANLGSPFPVPAGSRLTPRESTDGLNAPLTAP